MLTKISDVLQAAVPHKDYLSDGEKGKFWLCELLSEIERLAKMVITTIPKAKSFCMAMGSASFHCEWREWEDGDESDYRDCDEHMDAYELKDGNSYAEDLDDLLRKYDSKFKLTCYPMKIERDNVTGEFVTVGDW